MTGVIHMTEAITATFERSRLVQARWAVITIFLVNGAGLANWLTRVPAIKDTIQASKLEMSFVLLGPAIGALISFPITGYLLGRFGSRSLTILMSLLTCVALALISVGSSLPSFFILLFIFGFVNASMDVSMNAQAADVEAGLGTPIMSSFHGMFSAGGILGAALAGFLAGRGIGLFPHLPTVAVILALPISAQPFTCYQQNRNAQTHPSLRCRPKLCLLLVWLVFVRLLVKAQWVIGQPSTYVTNSLQVKALLLMVMARLLLL
jgi:predicted MFS family arabinose efflux permease